MSYVWDLSDSARSTLRQLSVRLQERLFDKLEALSVDVSRATTGAVSETSLYDFIYDEEQRRNYFFLTLTHDDASRILRVETIGFFSRLL